MESSTSVKTSSKPLTISEQQKAEWANEWKEKLREDERKRRREVHERALGGPVPYEEYTFEKFDPNLNGTHTILRACLAFDPTKANLLIIGGQGKGKTHLSSSIAHRVLDQGGRARVFRGNELAAQLRGRKVFAMDYDQVDAITDLLGVDVIVFDDVEDGPNKKEYLSAFKVLLEHRKNNRRYGFIITSNKTVSELADILGPKIADRIEGEFKHLVIPDSIPSARGILKRSPAPEKK